jgi:hypothetical protein
MPKCLHPPCPRQVADGLYCDEHQYEAPWMTNISRESEPYMPSAGFPSQGLPTAPRAAPPLLVPIILGVAILVILAVALIVILKLIF